MVRRCRRRTAASKGPAGIIGPHRNSILILSPWRGYDKRRPDTSSAADALHVGDVIPASSQHRLAFALRLILALIIALKVLSPPAVMPSPHGPAASVDGEYRHLAKVTKDHHGHGHDHETGSPKEHSPGHTHGHNATDHSHEPPSAFTQPLAIAFHPAREWSLSPFAELDRRSISQLDRPPRPISVI